MTMMRFCCPSRDTSDLFSDQCSNWFPCLSDPGEELCFVCVCVILVAARRSKLLPQLTSVMVHLVYIGFIFIFDTEFFEKLKTQPWYTLVYLLLFVATLVQYFITCGTSPGYVLDAMRDYATADASLRASEISNEENLLQGSSNNGAVVVTLNRDQLGEIVSGDNGMNWTNLVMDMYPPRTSVMTVTCSCCKVVQPPRAKHCHDCNNCVLRFDHHCTWLGTCIGQGNHCQFWWYLFEETALCIWTSMWYIELLPDYIREPWLIVIIIIMLAALSILTMFLLLLLIFHSYLIVTNQTTHEILRRRRIPYMRPIPERVYPFSKGICKNLYRFCCGRMSIYSMEALPSVAEVNQMSMPYSCFDVLSCRCC
ncbi:hypothetical protein OSB04_027570 [Centaurea solstitialis]|uniref:S-acyltransferase n=1 Tax=Centaurea solstitialis TaxID=347529 RepID=A0AA38SDU9_9ASTR|nr:hypothetical protein OSB04_027570 [Centaurea solstitialis]